MSQITYTALIGAAAHARFRSIAEMQPRSSKITAKITAAVCRNKLRRFVIYARVIASMSERKRSSLRR